MLQITLYSMKYRNILLGVLCAVFAPAASAQLVINELMQSNIDCIMDDLNEFPDSWVELYNAGSVVENLGEYSLGVKDKISKAYKLPAKDVPPGGFVVIYCDKEETGLHTSFRLESGKDGAVYLFHGNDIVDKLEGMKKMPAPNVAYGRVTDGAEEWGYQLVPTPGNVNTGQTSSKVLDEPEFSVPGRVSSESFTLEITVPEGSPEGTTVRYTTDGTEPTTSSRECVNGFLVNKTTVVRAKLFCDGYLSPRSTVQSYIFFPRQMTLPIVSVVCPDGYFNNNKIGIYVDGNYNSNKKNYEYDWRRPVNIELFENPDEASVINQLCETRVKGGASRGAKLKSLVMYANKRFGTKRFEYEFFPEDAPGLTDWKSFEMRNAGNDFDYLYFRDAAIQRMMGRNADLDWQPYRPAIFMLNGQYIGMLNIRSRSNEDYVYTFYDALEDIDMLENWWEVKEGTAASFYEFRNFYEGTGHSYAEFEERMDTREFAHLMLMNLYFDNKDFPGNNIVMWRPQADGGRWRWVAKDTDFGLGLYGAQYSFKTFNWLYDNSYDPDHAWANKPEHTRLFRRLMDTPEFSSMFFDMCAVYIPDFLSGNDTSDELDRMYAAIDYEYPYHRALINQWWPNHSQELQSAKTWIRNRESFFINHVADYFKLGTPRRVIIDKDRTDNVQLSVNGLELKKRGFDGKYYEGREIKVAGICPNGATVKKWAVTTRVNATNSSTSYEGEELRITVPAGCEYVEISSEPGSDGMDEVVADAIDSTSPVEIFDLQGRSLGEHAQPISGLMPGIYVVRQGGASSKVIVR